MSGNVVRIGDSVSCRDTAAEGSSNVFAEGMPISHRGKNKTTGHDGWPPSIFIGPFSSTVFVNNQPVVLKDKTKIKIHQKRRSAHDGVASTAAKSVFIEK
jgi:hypothetical protein